VSDYEHAFILGPVRTAAKRSYFSLNLYELIRRNHLQGLINSRRGRGELTEKTEIILGRPSL
jgi:hypothetical protein